MNTKTKIFEMHYKNVKVKNYGNQSVAQLNMILINRWHS